MARLKDAAVGRGPELLYFDPDQIQEDPDFNLREMESEATQAHIEQMFQAIMAGGIASFPPVTISQRDGEVILTAGYCRRRAFSKAKAAGAPIKGILCQATNMSSEERVLDILSSNSGLELTSIEKAKVVQRLQSFGWTISEIARRVGKSATAIQDLIHLLSAPVEVQQLVKDNVVSATLATEAVKQGTTEALKSAAEGRIRVTKKDVEVKPKTGIALYLTKSKRPDLFVEDPDEGVMPCGLCIHKKELEVCEGCRHNIEETEE